MLIFSVGYFAVFAVFVLLYLRAYRKREQLELTSWNFSTRLAAFRRYMLHCGIAIVSIASVLLGGPQMASVAGMIYMLTGVVMAVHGTVMGKRRRRLENKIASSRA